jgi:hypothetical protein
VADARHPHQRRTLLPGQLPALLTAFLNGDEINEPVRAVVMTQPSQNLDPQVLTIARIRGPAG